MEYIYAALLLHKAGKEITESAIKKIVEAAGIQADETKIKTLIASLQGTDIDKAISEAAMPAAAPAAVKHEEKKEEVKAEAAAEGLSALFG